MAKNPDLVGKPQLWQHCTLHTLRENNTAQLQGSWKCVLCLSTPRRRLRVTRDCGHA